MTTILEASGLGKRYEDFTLSDVALSIPRGTISGFFGANGAGKTTLMKLLAHQVPPSSGTVRVFGLSYADREVEIKNRIGYVPQEPVFYWGKSVRGTARFVRPFFDRWDGGLFYKLLDGFGVPREKKVKHLSRGQKTLLCLALALSHEAELLILDEPTAGLDVLHRREILDRLREFVANGERTVLVSSHVTDGLDEIAEYVYFLREGRIVLHEGKDDLLARFKRIQFKEGALETGLVRSLADVRHHPFGNAGLVSDFPAVRERLAAGIATGDVVVESARLEDVFVVLAKGA